MTLSITDSIFKHNIATESGGGIQSYSSLPSLKNNKFLNNSSSYGPDYASYAINLKLNLSSEILSLAPGQELNSSFTGILQDHYNQTTKTDFNSTAQIILQDQSNFSMTGLSKFISKSGIFSFSNFTIFGHPGTFLNLSIVPDFHYNSGKNIELDLKVALRKCLIGEVEDSGLKCSPCEEGTYNLKAGEKCLECPPGGKCYGDSRFVAAAGYWRYSKTTDTFIQCPNSNACLEEKVEGGTENCEVGYQGNCCQTCQPNYSKTSGNQCGKCLDKDKNSVIIAAVVLVFVMVLVFITAMNIKGAYKEESVISIYFKILMNYLQIVPLMISFDLSWPLQVKKMFDIQEKASVGSTQILSVDCFFQDTNERFFAKLVLFSLIPIFCFVFLVLFWFLWARIMKSNNIKEKFIGSIVVQLFFFQPSLLRLNFSVFNCLELAPGKYFMIDEMSIQCWTRRHLTFTIAVALPSLLVWCIGVPIILAVVLTKNRSRLDEITEKLKYGFLYKGFKNKHFYWEFVIMLKKILIVSVSVFLKNVSIPVQALVAFIIIVSSYVLQVKFEPYGISHMNVVEVRAIVVSGVTIYSGLFFLTGGLSYEAKLMMFILMVFSNFVFVIYWGYFTFGYYIAKIYLRLGCCKKLMRGRLDNWISKVVPEVINNDFLKEIEIEKNPFNSLSKLPPNEPNSPEIQSRE